MNINMKGVNDHVTQNVIINNDNNFDDFLATALTLSPYFITLLIIMHYTAVVDTATRMWRFLVWDREDLGM